MGFSVTIKRRVDFCDIDSMGVMWHGSYCRYLEDARCRLLEKIGFPYQVMEGEGYQIPIVSLSIKYSKPCCFDQEIEVTATLSEYKHFLIINYVICDSVSHKKFASAETKHAVYDILAGKAVLGLPKFMKDCLENYHE